MLASTTTSLMDHINIYKYLPSQKYSPKPPYPTTLIPANRRAPPLNSVQYTKIGDMWNLKHDISSP